MDRESISSVSITIDLDNLEGDEISADDPASCAIFEINSFDNGCDGSGFENGSDKGGSEG